MERPSGRAPDQLRPIHFTLHYTRHAEGSVLVEFGETRVLCTATVEERVPSWLKGSGRGWLTAEYSMLPRATPERKAREAARGRLEGRTMEIQRLIGRSLRAALDLEALGERTIIVDCDVLQADGGTRTASITGGYLALALAVDRLLKGEKLSQNPLKAQIASVSVGIYQEVAILDLDYAEDSAAEVDMNVVADQTGAYVELQGTAERRAFDRKALLQMLDLADKGITELLQHQRRVLEEAGIELP